MVSTQKTFPITVAKIAHDGAAEGVFEGKPVRIHGMLPHEEGIVEVTKKHGIYIGTLKELTKASPSRKTPEELHYLACSPWQVMEYPLQAELKQALIADLFAYHPDAPKVGFTPAAQFYGYRTKVEFSFCDRDADFTDENGSIKEIPLALAFHERGGGACRLALPEGCALASQGMNRVALAICKKLRDAGYSARDLKTLIVRESKSSGEILAVLFAKKEDIPEFPVDDIPNLSGFIVFHSTEKSPASVPTRGLWTWGEDHLTEMVDGLSIRYSWDSFFQNNIPVFEEALTLMRAHIKRDDRVLELYAGAGTIGLALAKHAKTIHGVEIVPAAVDAAMMNARVNGVENYTTECLPAEKIDGELFSNTDVLVLDPPRAGLHPKLIEHINDKRPQKIIYLSCNPETQARNYSALAELYAIDMIQGLDFYPQTPHVESLLVLTIK